MKIFLIILGAIVLAMLASVAALSVARHSPASTGEITRETRSVSGFTRIDIEGLAEVTLNQGPSEGVTIEAPAPGLPRIRTEVRGGTLLVSAAEQRHVWQWLSGSGPHRTPRITINLRRLERIQSAGAVKVSADNLRADELSVDFAGACSLKIGDLQANKLRLGGSGAVKARIAGKVTEQDVDLSGAGSYDASDLVSDHARVEVSGAGKAVINATTSLKVDLSGAGLVEYIGNPKVEKDISGIGKVRQRAADSSMQQRSLAG